MKEAILSFVVGLTGQRRRVCAAVVVMFSGLCRLGLEHIGCVVHLCFDGGTGLRHATQHAFDILLVDVGLPVLDGFEITKRLRLLGLHIPILLLADSPTEEDELRGFDASADDYILKPLGFELLVARLRARTRAATQGNLSKLRFADLMLDAERRKVTRAGRELDLTRTEFSVLKQLMRCGGKVAQRDRLIETLWPDKFVSNNNLDTFIRCLRQKVDAPGLPRLIHTERGVGYYLHDSAVVVLD